MFRSMQRAIALATAVVMPLTAAHPTETATHAPAAGAFDRNFEGFAELPGTSRVADGAVDVTEISHSQPEADDEVAGKALAGGMASYYGRQFEGKRTASGERFAMAELTGAHRTLPFGSQVRVTNAANGRSVVVRINDRGPFHSDRVIDVSRAAAQRLGLVASGSAKVSLTLLD